VEEARADFAGRTVIVIGGGQGLGRQYALDLGACEANVVVASRSDNANVVAAEILAAGGRAIGVVADVRRTAMVVEQAMKSFGSIDGMIVNAGVTRDRSFAKMSQEDWSDVLSIHVDGAFACAKAVWGSLVEGGGGSILFTTSGAAFHGAFGQSNYATAKAGLLGLTRSLAIEGARVNIRANALAPMASTAMTDGVFDDALKAGLIPEDVSPYALALIHPSNLATGQIIEAGGGWAAAMRWKRSRGLRLDRPDVASVLGRWNEVTDFDEGWDHPQTTLDSLGAAMGAKRKIITAKGGV
jgi:NAD(P)-dependent dehydrogenase (short-subunit alcohol dehydrogenase family)